VAVLKRRVRMWKLQALQHWWRPLLVCAIVLIASGIVILQNESREQQALADQFRLQTHDAGGFLARYFDDQEILLQARAEDLLAGPVVSVGQLQAVTSGLGFASGGVIDGHGRLLMNVPFNLALIGGNYSTLDYVHQAMVTNRAAVSQVRTSRNLQAPVVGIAVPYNTASGRRIVSGVIRVDGPSLTSLLQTSVSLQTSALYLVDRHGDVIADGVLLKGGITPFAQVAPALARALAQGASGTFRDGGGNAFFATSPVDATGWRLITVVGTGTLYQSIDAGETSSRLLLGAFWFATLLAALWYGLSTQRRQHVRRMLIEERESARFAARLAAERDRLQHVLDAIPEAVVILDADARITAVNPVGQAVFGVNLQGERRDQVDLSLRRPDGALIPLEQLPSRRALQAGETTRGMRIIVHDATTGEDVPTLANCAPLRDANGTIAGAVDVSQDISVLVELEQEREQLLARLEAILASSAHGVHVVDLNGYVTYSNAEAARILGDQDHLYEASIAQRTSMLGATRADGVPVRPEDTPSRRVLRGETVRNQLVAVDVRHDGSRRWLSLSAAPMRTAAGQVVGAVTTFVDVTEQRSLQEERERLLASEQRAHGEAQAERTRLQQILDALPAGVAVYDGAGQIIAANPAAQAVLGTDPVGRNLASIEKDPLRWDGTPLPREQYPAARVLRSGETVRGERFIIHHPTTGAEAPVLVNAAPLRDEAGTIIGAVSVYQDIAAIVELERQREELLAGVQIDRDRLQAVLAVTDTALSSLPTQEALEQLLARVADVLAVDNAALLLLTEDRGSLAVYLARGPEHEQVGATLVPLGHGIAGRIAASRQPLVVDDVSSADVSNVHLLDTVRSLAGVPVLVQDRLVGVLHVDSALPRHFTAADVEVLRLVAERIGLVVDNGRLYAEEQQRSTDLAVERDLLQRILDVLPEAVIIYDADSRVTLMNRLAEEHLGPDTLGKQRANHEVEVSRPDGSPLALDEMPTQRALHAGETSRGVRLLLRTGPAEADLPILESCTPLRDPEGAIIGAAAVFQDISSIVQLERQRDRMLSMVTHDLRNPLTSVNGMSQLLRLQVSKHVEEPARERITQGLKTIEAAAGRMMTQISDLLDHTRAQAGRALDLALETTDIVGLVRSVLEDQQHATDLHVLELRCAEERLTAGVDRRRLERAVTNLVVNAIKYSPQGGPVVVTVAQAAGPDGPWVSIEVADSGVGIPTADLPHMFEEYYRASNVIGTIPGNGIGLAGVRHVAKSHGGTVTLSSAEGVGTTVTVRLPLRREAEAQGDAER